MHTICDDSEGTRSWALASGDSVMPSIISKAVKFKTKRRILFWNCLSLNWRTYPRLLIDMATSSKDAFPARSPIPLMVHSHCRAPLKAPAKLFAVASPRSFWQWVEMTTFSAPGVFARIPAIFSPNSCGIHHPTCKTTSVTLSINVFKMYQDQYFSRREISQQDKFPLHYLFPFLPYSPS